MISNAKIKVKLFYILGISILSVLSVIGINRYVVDSVKIGSKTYQEVVNSKDLLADILPPPAYIIEARLITYELLHAKTSEQKEQLFTKLIQLEKDLHTRDTYWKENLTNKEIALQFDEAFVSGVKYFEFLNNHYVPAIKNNNLEQASLFLVGDLENLYLAHRKNIDVLVNSSIADSKNIESKAIKQLDNGMLITYLGAFVCILLTFVLSMGIMKNITRSVEKVQKGLLSFFAFLQRDTKNVETINLITEDEFGEMAKIINKNVQQIEASINKDNEFVADAGRFVGELKQGNNTPTFTKESNTPALLYKSEYLNSVFRII